MRRSLARSEHQLSCVPAPRFSATLSGHPRRLTGEGGDETHLHGQRVAVRHHLAEDPHDELPAHADCARPVPRRGALRWLYLETSRVGLDAHPPDWRNENGLAEVSYSKYAASHRTAFSRKPKLLFITNPRSRWKLSRLDLTPRDTFRGPARARTCTRKATPETRDTCARRLSSAALRSR